MLRAAFSHKNDGLALKLEGRPVGALEGVGYGPTADPIARGTRSLSRIS